MDKDEIAESSFVFHGSWREFAPIAFTNLLLTIVTLGIYRFWATTRERKYFWSQSQFIDERLEWTGTGKELFFGFLVVLVLFSLPLLFMQFGFQALILQGYVGTAFVLFMLMFMFIFYLGGLARFRALRYRMGRTYWHGIRGGANDQGFVYGWSYIWKTMVGYLPGGLLIPWSMVELWNERWNKMSFGQHRFESASDFGKLMPRFIFCYIVPFVLFFVIMIVIVVAGVGMLAASDGTFDPDSIDPDDPSSAMAFMLLPLIFVFGFYGILGVAMLGYLSKYYRIVVGGLSLHDLEFGFTARTKDWFKLILGDIGLVIITLGIGYIFLSYRHWKFFIDHMHAYGEIDLAALTQSTTERSKHGEGLLDAFDVGAI